MWNLEERPYKKSRQEEASPARWDDAALSLFKPRVIALQREKQKEDASPLSRLPDHVALSCLALLSRSDHAALFFVSKRCRSLVASPELYKMRSLTKTYVYVCLRTPKPRWYILHRRGDASDLIPIPSFPTQSWEGSSVVALDGEIYVIGGLINGRPTSDVLVLDCRTHTWRHAPSMGVARASAAAAVVDGKIYVLGGCTWHDYCLDWGEVFDPKTQTWDSLPQQLYRRRLHNYIRDCVVKDGKVYAVNGSDETIYYSPSEAKWGQGNRGVGGTRDWCVIDNLIFALSKSGSILWCDKNKLNGEPKAMDWTCMVNGLVSLQEKLSRSRVVHFGDKIVDMHEQAQGTHDLPSLLPRGRLVNCDGNILLFWDQIEMMVGLQIWCAEISLERRQGGQIWGNIEWSHPVITYAPRLHPYKVLYNVSVTL